MNPRTFTEAEWPSVLERIKPRNGYPNTKPIDQSRERQNLLRDYCDV